MTLVEEFCIPRNPLYDQSTNEDIGLSEGIEYCIDDVSPHRRPKYCYHTWFSDLVHPITRIQTEWQNTGITANAITRDNSRIVLRLAQGAQSYQPEWTSLGLWNTLDQVPSAMSQSLMTRMLPKVNDGTSLINFILELKDLRRMFNFKSLEKLKRMYDDSLKSGDIMRRWLRQRKNDVSIKDVSDDFLNYKFGWAPFIGDLLAMLKALRGLNKRLDYLVNNTHRKLKRFASVDLPHADFPTWAPGSVSMNAAFGRAVSGTSDVCVYTRSARWVYKPRYTMSLTYSYTLPRVSEVRRKIRAYLDAFGVRMDPSIVWNAIPFSFVIDWVVDVGNWLRQFSPNDLGMEIAILDASHSLKWHYVSDIAARIPRFPSDTNPIIRELVTRERRHYVRGPWIPTLASPSVALPSGMQYTLAGALAISGRKGKYRYGD